MKGGARRLKSSIFADIADCKLYDNKSNNNRQFSLLSNGILSHPYPSSISDHLLFISAQQPTSSCESEGGKL